MKLQHIFDSLSSGEFSQLAIGGQDMGVINPANYRQVLNHVNLGLEALFRRFHLKENRVTVALQNNFGTYALKSDFAVTNLRSSQPVRYILDSVDAPFKDDILKITRVLTEFGDEMSLNDIDDDAAVLTPSATTIEVPRVVAHQTPATPEWLRTSKLTVVYRASHPVLNITLGLFDPKRVEVELPESHLEALLYFVASRVHNPIGMSNEFHAGNNYAAKYEAACMELLNLGMESRQSGHNMGRMRKGFP